MGGHRDVETAWENSVGERARRAQWVEVRCSSSSSEVAAPPGKGSVAESRQVLRRPREVLRRPRTAWLPRRKALGRCFDARASTPGQEDARASTPGQEDGTAAFDALGRCFDALGRSGTRSWLARWPGVRQGADGGDEALFRSLLPSLRGRVRPSSFPCFTATRVIRTTAHLHFLHLSSNRHRTCLSEAPAQHPWYTDCRYNRQRKTRAHRQVSKHWTRAHRQVSKHWHRRASKHRRLSRRCWTPCRRRRGKA